MVTQTYLLVEKEDVVFEILVQFLELSNLCFELVATLVCAPYLLDPLLGLALIDTILGRAITVAGRVRISVLSHQSV